MEIQEKYTNQLTPEAKPRQWTKKEEAVVKIQALTISAVMAS